MWGFILSSIYAVPISIIVYLLSLVGLYIARKTNAISGKHFLGIGFIVFSLMLLLISLVEGSLSIMFLFIPYWISALILHNNKSNKSIIFNQNQTS